MVNRLVLLTGAAFASPVAAQISNTVGIVAVPPSQAPTPTPTPTSPPPTSLPTTVPVAPPPVVTTVTPAPAPSPTASPRRRATAATPRQDADPTPTPTPTPLPSSSPITATPVLPSPVVTPTPTVTPAPTATATAPSDAAGGLPWWAFPAGLVSLLLLGAAVYAWRRGREEEEPASAPLVEEAGSVATPMPLARERDVAPPATPAPQFLEPTAPLAPRPALEVEVVPRRAGVNLLTATADMDVTVTNRGDARASAVRVGAHLTSAQPGQDDALQQVFAQPVTRPAATPFDLAPGESRTIRMLLTLAREAIVTLSARDRPMFIPVVAINATYAGADGQAGQTAAAFAIGVEREGAAKLAPFWLDGPSRMHDRLAVRPHALALRS